MALAKLPGGCRALIVDGEPLQALALECLLEELGCQPVGPARSVAEVEQRLRQEHPNFAWVDCGLVEWLTPLAACLDRSWVPFALLAVGAEGATLDRIECVRDRPRLTRPYHGPSLHAVAVALYRADLRAKIEEADRHLVEGRSRLARQLRLIERLEAAGQDTALANAHAHRCQQDPRSRPEPAPNLAPRRMRVTGNQDKVSSATPELLTSLRKRRGCRLKQQRHHCGSHGQAGR